MSENEKHFNQVRKSMVISLIGRPNVGKSTIFNRLMGKTTKALTHDLPGVTRDRHYGMARLKSYKHDREMEVILVDTGGFYPQSIEVDFAKVKKEGSYKDQEKAKFDTFFNIMSEHAHMAIEESDLVLFILDVREGLNPFDESICHYIRSTKKKFWAIVNKYDSDKQAGMEADFYSLGMDELFLVSGAHGRGIEDLIERIFEQSLFFQGSQVALQKGVIPSQEVVARLSIIGAPNAGKSTLLNQLVGSKRALVSDIAGTTVDPIEGFFDIYFGKNVEFLKENELSVGDQVLITEYQRLREQGKLNTNWLIEDEEESFENETSFEDESIIEDGIFDINSDQSIEDQLFSDDGEPSDQSDRDDEYEDDTEHDLENDPENEYQFDIEVENDECDDHDFENESLKPTGDFWRSIHIVDTAGIRKKSNIYGHIETQSVFRALRCITDSDIVLMVVDATKGIGHQDRRLLDIAIEKGKSVIVVMNKMDLLKKSLKTSREKKDWLLDLKDTIPWLSFCDIIPISAKYANHIGQLKKSIAKTVLVRHKKINTSDLNQVVTELVDRNPIILKGSRGSTFKVKYASMVRNSPPTFLLFTNKSKSIPDNYRRYLQNGLRFSFGLDNTPVHLVFRTGSDLEKRAKEMESRKS